MSTPSLSKLFSISVLALSLISLTGCSSDDEETTGEIKFYNAEADSPELFLTIDENLDEDDDDEIEVTFSSVGFGEASSATEIPTNDYFYEVAYQDDDSTQRDDLEIIAEGSLTISQDDLTFIVMTGSVNDATANIFSIEIDESDDLIDDDEFSLQVLNAHPNFDSVDVYFSDDDETFAEAQLIGTANSLTFTEAVNLDEDTYKVYLTLPGSTDVIFESDEVSYLFNTQYFLMIRENVGAGGNLFQLDNLTFSGSETVDAANSLATIRFYNGIHNHPSLADYSGQVDLTVSDVASGEVVLSEQLASDEISDITITAADDFSLTLVDSNTGALFIENALFSVPENTARTVFFYVDEEYVDEDGDGIIDEDEDGQIDEIEAFVRTVIVEDDTRDAAVTTQISILNLADNEDFSTVTIAFVDSDETLEDVDDVRSVSVGTSSDITLLNNTYDVFAVASVDNQATILDSFSLTLNDDSASQFLLLEFDETSPSGYSLKLVSQLDE